MLHLDSSGYGYKPRPKTIMRQYGGASISVAMDTQRRMLSLLKATVFLFGLFACATGEIRCYCNDASCVRTGYMCKSAMGRCFSQLTYERESTRSVHGCAESLPLADRDLCEGSGNVAETKTGGGDKVQWPILICCKEEMCNYMDNLDISIYVTKSNGTKDSAWSNLADQQQPLRNPGEEEVYLPGGAPPYIVNSSSDNDLWFKAAVIAVPIAGGFILVLLVLLAVRVLRNDNRRHRQLVQMRRHRSLAKAQLYVADHFYQNELVGEKCAECQSAQCQGQGAVCQGQAQYLGRGDASRPIVCGVNGVGGVVGGGGGVTVVGCGIKSKSNHSRRSISKDQRHAGQIAGSSPYRDVHLKLDHSKNGYEKIQPLSDGSTFDDDSYESVVVWGDPGKLEMAAPV